MPARLLIISQDIVGPTMAGPGIRYWQLARVLSRHVATTLAVPLADGQALATLPPAGFDVATYKRREWATLAPLAAQAEVCLLPSDIADELPELAQLDACLVIDGYDPLMAEWLALSTGMEDTVRETGWQQRRVELASQLAIGDFFLCASERQRDWWLGLLEASGRINPATYAADPSLRRLVDVVPYGLPSDPLPAPQPVIRGVWPGIGANDRLLLWGGGLWPWLDPLTAVRAAGILVTRHSDLKLVFPGVRHPNPAMAGMPNQVEAARTLAGELGILDRAVFFGDWVAYSQWPHVLQESTLAISLHHETFETRLAFRSRALETIWAHLPSIVTAGDATAELIGSYDLGAVVAPNDLDAVVAAADRLLLETPADRSRRFEVACAALSWEQAAMPLLRFCQTPQRAPDRIGTPSATHDLADALRADRDHWRALAQAYANGRIMRTLTRFQAYLRR